MKGIDIETRTFNLLPRQFSMQTSIWSSSGKRFKAKKKYATGYIVSKKSFKVASWTLGNGDSRRVKDQSSSCCRLTDIITMDWIIIGYFILSIQRPTTGESCQITSSLKGTWNLELGSQTIRTYINTFILKISSVFKKNVHSPSKTIACGGICELYVALACHQDSSSLGNFLLQTSGSAKNQDQFLSMSWIW